MQKQKTNKLNYFLVLLFILPTLAGNAQKTLSVRIDLENARGGTVTDVFKTVKFIPLETTGESVFGQIYKLIVTENLFIIRDVETDAILFFNKDGKYKGKIKKRKPDEYIGDFTINRAKNEIIVRVSGDKALIYNFEGKLLKEEPLMKEVEGIHHFKMNKFAFNIARPLEYSPIDQKGYDVVYSDGLNQMGNQYFEYNNKYMKYEYNIPHTLFNDLSDGTCIYTFPYSYTLSQLNESGILRQFRLIFPNKYSLPPNFETDSIFTGKRKEYIFGKARDFSKIKEVTPFFKENDYLIFHITKVGGRISDADDLLYSLKTSTVYSFGRISGDKTSFSIPILDSSTAEKLHSVYNQNVYTSIPSDFLLRLLDSPDIKEKYQEQLQKIFGNIKNKDNPVLIESTLKNNL